MYMIFKLYQLENVDVTFFFASIVVFIFQARAKIRKARRKSTELQCSLLMHGIREHLAAIKSEKYLTQLKDHLSNLNALVRKEESLEQLLQWYVLFYVFIFQEYVETCLFT